VSKKQRTKLPPQATTAKKSPAPPLVKPQIIITFQSKSSTLIEKMDFVEVDDGKVAWAIVSLMAISGETARARLSGEKPGVVKPPSGIIVP